MTALAWGILGAGRIAGTFAGQLASADAGTCLAVGSRRQASADAFGDKHGVERRYGGYEALLEDPEVDVVYVATPHTFHAEWAIRALEAGKHVLCEKPLTLNFAQAEAVVEAARMNDRFLMEAFMYRCHPQTARLVDLVTSGAIGEVHVIEATHSYRTSRAPRSRLFAPELGGGGILDVGGYPISMARLLAGAASGQPFAEPIEMAAYGAIGPTGVDEYAVGILKFPGEVVAQVASGIRASQGGPMVRISGSEGEIRVGAPWTCGDRNTGPTSSKITVNAGGTTTDLLIESDRGRYATEAEHVAECISNGLRESPLMSWDDSLGNMVVLDRWREAIGLRYPDELPEQVPTVTRRPLARSSRAPMAYGRIKGIDLPVSRLVLGRGVDVDMRVAAPTMDGYFEQGGNCFDTAYLYDAGERERTVGRWLTSRGVRGDVVILGKGAHTPACHPAGIDKELAISLERLQVDYLDIYMLHRDNYDVPVGEFMDALNRHIEAGRVRVIGVSNWRINRIDEANKWAAERGLPQLVAVSNQLSLAKPVVEQIWPGCVNGGGPGSISYFTRTQMAMMPWSSQSQGFFAQADPADLSNKAMVRRWYGDDNFERLRRARELAVQRGVDPVNIALAWVLGQPFPTFPLIGPCNLRELNSSMRALEIELTPEEMRWLDLDEVQQEAADQTGEVTSQSEPAPVG